MLSHPPQLAYRGLTILMSNPSRFDKQMLLSGQAGTWFNDTCLRPEINRFQSHVLDIDAWNKLGRTFLDGTKVVLCCGPRAMKECMGILDNTLGQQRGAPIIKDGIIFIATFNIQDTHDFKDFESYLNPHLNGGAQRYDASGNAVAASSEDGNDDTDEEAGNEKSRHGVTNRANYRFWVTKDTKKAIRILKNGYCPVTEPTYNIYPNSQQIIHELTTTKSSTLYVDIETDTDFNITCFGYSFNDIPVINVVPLLRYNYTPAYSNNGAILRALARAFRDNTTVAHNGAGFDFLVFPFKYHVAVDGLLYDTMIAVHRCFPEIEKSLGHSISLFTDLPFHKDEGIFEPHNEYQEQSLWKYNGKDVHAMREVHKGITEYAATVVGLPESIRQANESIRPYITTTLQGIRYRKDLLEEIVSINDRKLTQILRIINTLIGPESIKYVRGSSKSGMPGSSTQCVRYFHDLMGYPVLQRSAITKKPKLDEKSLLKLAIKHPDNPIIDLVLLYRGIAKETGSLGFIEWPGLLGYNKLER
jgi:hypothetical protein